MTGLILAFITYIGWGTGDIFGAFASRSAGSYRATSLILAFGLIIASLFIPLALQDLGKVTPVLFFLNFIFGIIIMLGQFFVNEAFKRSSVSLIGIIIQSFPAVVLILSALIFKDPVTLKQTFWIIIIFIGVFLCMVNFKDFKKSQLFTDLGIKLALIAAVMFSVYFTFSRIFLDAYGWFWPNYFSFLSFPIAIILFKKFY